MTSLQHPLTTEQRRRFESALMPVRAFQDAVHSRIGSATTSSAEDQTLAVR